MSSRGALLTVPNLVSGVRLVLAPLFVATPRLDLRIGLVAAAAATDVLDGWLARRQRVASRAGAFIDPMADRVFVLTAIATLVAEGSLTLLQAALLLSRDIMTTIGFVVARTVRWLRPVELKARVPGKLVTTLQIVALLAVLLMPARVTPLVVAVAALSAVAVADYTLALWRARIP